MFGLEKQPSKNNKLFEFDLEKEFKTNPGSRTKITKEAEEKIVELKNILRKGMDSDEEFEEYGVILRGYAALKKVIQRIGK